MSRSRPHDPRQPRTQAEREDQLFWRKVAAGDLDRVPAVRKYAERHYPSKLREYDALKRDGRH